MKAKHKRGNGRGNETGIFNGPRQGRRENLAGIFCKIVTVFFIEMKIFFVLFVLALCVHSKLLFFWVEDFLQNKYQYEISRRPSFMLQTRYWTQDKHDPSRFEKNVSNIKSKENQPICFRPRSFPFWLCV